MAKSIVTGEKARVGDWVASRVKRTTPWTDFEAIGLEKDGVLVAGVVFDGYVANARCCMHVAAEGKDWLNREFLWFCFYYAFEQMKCKQVIGLVDANNESALKFDKHLGFEEACRIPEGSGDSDLVILTMPRKTCRWLDLKRA